MTADRRATALAWLRARDSPAARTLAATFVMVVAFAVEQLAVAVAGAAGIPSFLAARSQPTAAIVQLAAPVLHSSGAHLVGNLLYFVPLSLLFAQRTSLAGYAAWLYGFGLVANQIVPMAARLAGADVALAVGVSGVTYALAAHETLRRGWPVGRELAAGGEPGRRRLALALVAVAFGVERATALLAPASPTGVSRPAHAAGFGVGAAVALVAMVRQRSGAD